MDTPPITLITGANKGIGLETARQLARRGAHVLLTSRNESAGRQAVDTLQAELARRDDGAGRIQFLPLDVSDLQSIQNAARQAAGSVPRLDILINNAAILISTDRSIFDMSEDALMRTLWTNVLGVHWMTQAFLSLLLKSQRPRIINVSSGSGSLTDMEHWEPAYSISKTALNALTRQWGLALEDRGAAVNAVCPGWVRTDMGGLSAPRPVEQGADGIVWLALDAPQDLTGKFLRDRREIDW